MPRKSPNSKKPAQQAPDPAFGAIDVMIERSQARFNTILNAVKPEYHPRFLAIIEHTDAYCINHLEPLHREYELYCHIMAATLCDEGSPVVEGRAGPEGWAAAIVAALGFVNFLSDPEFPPVKTMAEVAAAFGVSESGLHAKSRQIRNLLDLNKLDPDWTLPSLLADNPLVWMLETASGVIVDVRQCSRASQVAAFEAGLIPYIPADAPDGPDLFDAPHDAAADVPDPPRPPRATPKSAARKSPATGPKLFGGRDDTPQVETKPQRNADVLARIGPRAGKR